MNIMWWIGVGAIVLGAVLTGHIALLLLAFASGVCGLVWRAGRPQ